AGALYLRAAPRDPVARGAAPPPPPPPQDRQQGGRGRAPLHLRLRHPPSPGHDRDRRGERVHQGVADRRPAGHRRRPQDRDPQGRGEESASLGPSPRYNFPEFRGMIMRVGLAGMLLLSLSACSNLTPVNEDLRSSVGEEDLRQLQLYVSSDIELSRVLRSEEAGVTAKHSLRVDKGRRVEEVLIAAGTPGILVKAEK